MMAAWGNRHDRAHGNSSGRTGMILNPGRPKSGKIRLNFLSGFLGPRENQRVIFCDPFGVVSLFLLLLRGCRPSGLTPRLMAVNPPGSCGGPKTGRQSGVDLDTLVRLGESSRPFLVGCAALSPPYGITIVNGDSHLCRWNGMPPATHALRPLSGRKTENELPRPSLLWASILPPWASTIILLW